MAQLKSIEEKSEANEASADQETAKIAPPPRTLTVEFFVGIFMLLGLAAAGYQAVGLGGLQFMSDGSQVIYAEFDNVAGLKAGAPVEIAGVSIGEVSDITLNDPFAMVAMKIKQPFQLRDDDIASIRTKGIIGDRYVKISRGGSDLFLKEGETLTETESVVDIEDLIGKFVHTFGSEEEEDSEDF